MPLLSRYLRSGQQISRFPKIAENEKTARTASACPWMLDVLAGPGDADDYPDGLIWLALTAETIEFPVSDASEKSMPLPRGEHQDWPYGVSAVANADLATGQARHLDAVAVGVTQGALNPVET